MCLLGCVGGLAHPRDPARLDTVVVTATREAEDVSSVPATVTRVDAREIRRARPRVSVAESLQRVPGVAARDRQNLAQDTQIAIRGFGSRATFGVRGVRLYTDGIPASSPDGQGQVSHFALDAADALEVLRGPFSALYGNSSGGVIQILSAPPPDSPRAEAGASFGSDAAMRTSLGAAGPWKNREGGYRVDASRFDTDGYRDHSAARRESAQATLLGASASGELRLIANTVDIDADDPQGLTATELAADPRAASAGALAFDTRKRVRQRQVGARATRQLGADLEWISTVHAGQRDTVQFLSVPVAAQRNPLSGGGVIDLVRAYAGVDVRIRSETEWLSRPLSVTVGLESQTSHEDRRGFENFVDTTLGVRGALRRDERNRAQNFDQYAQLDWRASERWRVLAGVRRSDVDFAARDRFVTAGNPDDSGDLSYSEVTPVAGVSFRAASETWVYANAGKGFETPTFSELAYRSDGNSGLNSDLRAARSDNAEIGVRTRGGGHAFDLTVFRSWTRDELAVASNAGGRSTFANAGSSRRQGVEIAASGVYGERWRYAAAYTWLDARYRDGFEVCAGAPCVRPDARVAAGARIPGIARHTGFAELVYAVTSDFDIAVSGRASDRVFADDRNSASAAGFAVFDASATRRWRFGGIEMEAFARIDNLLDHDIVGSVIVNESNGRYFEPSPGRNWLIGIDTRLEFH